MARWDHRHIFRRHFPKMQNFHYYQKFTGYWVARAPAISSKTKRSHNQLQKYWRQCSLFWLDWPAYDLPLVTPPPPPISKLIAIQEHAQQTRRNNFERRGGGRYVIYPTDMWLAVIWSKKGCFLSECLNIFATVCSSKREAPEGT